MYIIFFGRHVLEKKSYKKNKLRRPPSKTKKRDLPEGTFAKDFSLLTEWPKDPHRHGMGED
jgi:hypothetical protein